LHSFPESERKRRDHFRADLLQTGFGLLYSGVYISPWPYREEVAELISKHDASAFVTVISGKIEHGAITEDQVEEIWSLRELARIYSEKQSWFEEHFNPMFHSSLERLTSVDASESDALELFVLFLTLGETINELYLIDPMLPPELLPSDWSGRTILQRLTEGLAKIIEAIPSDSVYARYVK
jgi:phenylacetic acid degradation operon negative regulatory protein